jgi:hypothetical protein
MSLTIISLAGIIKLFPARDSLVSDIPAGDRKIINLFFTVYRPWGLPRKERVSFPFYILIS